MQPLLATAAIVLKKDEVLLVKRGREPFKGMWSFPGGVGGFKRTDNPDEAVKGEVEYDTGRNFKGKFFTMNFENFGKPTVVLYYVGEIDGEPVKPIGKNVIEVKYFSIEEALKMKLGFKHEEILRKYLASNFK